MSDMKQYQVTKKQCQADIDKLNNVCDRCGRKIVPIETVNNSGEPTYWAGCFHGDNSKGAWGHFTHGVSKEVFDLAEKLVCEGERCYSHNQKSEYADSQEKRLYWFQTEVSGFCNLLRLVNYLKSNEPRKTKKEFLEDEHF